MASEWYYRTLAILGNIRLEHLVLDEGEAVNSAGKLNHLVLDEAVNLKLSSTQGTKCSLTSTDESNK